MTVAVRGFGIAPYRRWLSATREASDGVNSMYFRHASEIWTDYPELLLLRFWSAVLPTMCPSARLAKFLRIAQSRLAMNSEGELPETPHARRGLKVCERKTSIGLSITGSSATSRFSCVSDPRTTSTERKARATPRTTSGRRTVASDRSLAGFPQRPLRERASGPADA